MHLSVLCLPLSTYACLQGSHYVISLQKYSVHWLIDLNLVFSKVPLQLFSPLFLKEYRNTSCNKITRPKSINSESLANMLSIALGVLLVTFEKKKNQSCRCIQSVPSKYTYNLNYFIFIFLECFFLQFV